MTSDPRVQTAMLASQPAENSSPSEFSGPCNSIEAGVCRLMRHIFGSLSLVLPKTYNIKKKLVEDTKIYPQNCEARKREALRLPVY